MPQLLLCYGEGGHREQARRLLSRLNASCSKTETLRVLHVVDDASASLAPADATLVLHPLGKKHDGQVRRVWTAFSALVRNILIVRSRRTELRSEQVTLVVSLGPSFAAVPALLARLQGNKVIHIESWSRFYSRSWASLIFSLIATEFWVQNESLLALYPKARFVGRL